MCMCSKESLGRPQNFPYRYRDGGVTRILGGVKGGYEVLSDSTQVSKDIRTAYYFFGIRHS